nr:MAG TPA: hypothetical protein [Caudoviricetes sp.]
MLCGRYCICLPTLATVSLSLRRCFASGRQILTCHLCLNFGSVPSGLYCGIYSFLVLFSRSGFGSLLVCTLPRRGEIIYEGIFPLYFIYS